jgi:hypothetical protein
MATTGNQRTNPSQQTAASNIHFLADRNERSPQVNMVRCSSSSVTDEACSGNSHQGVRRVERCSKRRITRCAANGSRVWNVILILLVEPVLDDVGIDYGVWYIPMILLVFSRRLNIHPCPPIQVSGNSFHRRFNDNMYSGAVRRFRDKS